MAFTYSGNPATSTSDALRALTGDTDEAIALLTNEEIAWLISQYGTPALALRPALQIMLAKALHATLIREGNVERDIKSRLDTLRAMLTEETATLITVASTIFPAFLGGVSIAERDARRAEDDLIQPAWTVERETPA